MSPYDDLSEHFREDEKKYLNKKVKLTCQAYGSKNGNRGVSIRNLSPIQSGTIGTVINVPFDKGARTWFLTIGFANGIFVNINPNAVELSQA